jgi:hypothetical protein
MNVCLSYEVFVFCILVQGAVWKISFTFSLCILQQYAVKSLHNECLADGFRYMKLRFSLNGEGHAVAQLVEALHYKLEGNGFDSRCGDGGFSLT